MAKKKKGPGRPRISESKKLKNKQMYKQIRKAYNKVGGGENGLTYIQFKNRVLKLKEGVKESKLTNKIYKVPKLSTRSAIKAVTTSTNYVAVGTRLVQNMLKGLRSKYPTQYQKLREFCRDAKGHYLDLLSHITWDAGSKWYVCRNGKGETMTISLLNSPEQVILTLQAAG